MKVFQLFSKSLVVLYWLQNFVDKKIASFSSRHFPHHFVDEPSFSICFKKLGYFALKKNADKINKLALSLAILAFSFVFKKLGCFTLATKCFWHKKWAIFVSSHFLYKLGFSYGFKKLYHFTLATKCGRRIKKWGF